jgi:succinate-semialdehyde dehydrogenase/glutarate-semialdehyde dehydrogenase
VIEQHVAEARQRGAKVLTGGQRNPDWPGLYFEPTVLTEVDHDMQVMREETFGPVLPIMRVRDEEEALRLANDTDFGLVAYFYTRDLGRAHRIMEGLEYGMVGVNQGMVSNPAAPFGGVKHSGFGREGGYEGIQEYLETKYCAITP